MTRAERIRVLEQLGAHLAQPDEYREAVIHRSFHHNPWFTKENQHRAIAAIARKMLKSDKLSQWLDKYDMPEPRSVRKVALVLAGNIPLMGFHDVLSVFVSGHHAVIKLSDKDPYLLPYLVKKLVEFDPRVEAYFSFVEKTKDFDAVIATPRNNSARYFEAYFQKYPHIIRRNRHAVGVLTGDETPEQLAALGEDVFRYFGLGCRNVSKIYVPRGYDFAPLLEALHEFREIVLHDKYKNNFDYNYAIFVLNKVPYMANGCIILTENPAVPSHIAGLHYEYYDNLDQVKQEIQAMDLEIECVVAPDPEALPVSRVFPFGQTQEPELWEYADDLDTLSFLASLH